MRTYQGGANNHVGLRLRRLDVWMRLRGELFAAGLLLTSLLLCMLLK